MERKLAAILSADVKGYSLLTGEDDVAAIRILTTYGKVMHSLIQQPRGRIIDSPGDNRLAASFERTRNRAAQFLMLGDNLRRYKS